MDVKSAYAAKVDKNAEVDKKSGSRAGSASSVKSQDSAKSKASQKELRDKPKKVSLEGKSAYEDPKDPKEYEQKYEEIISEITSETAWELIRKLSPVSVSDDALHRTCLYQCEKEETKYQEACLSTLLLDKPPPSRVLKILSGIDAKLALTTPPWQRIPPTKKDKDPRERSRSQGKKGPRKPWAGGIIQTSAIQKKYFPHLTGTDDEVLDWNDDQDWGKEWPGTSQPGDSKKRAPRKRANGRGADEMSDTPVAKAASVVHPEDPPDDSWFRLVHRAKVTVGKKQEQIGWSSETRDRESFEPPNLIRSEQGMIWLDDICSKKLPEGKPSGKKSWYGYCLGDPADTSREGAKTKIPIAVVLNPITTFHSAPRQCETGTWCRTVLARRLNMRDGSAGSLPRAMCNAQEREWIELDNEYRNDINHEAPIPDIGYYIDAIIIFYQERRQATWRKYPDEPCEYALKAIDPEYDCEGAPVAYPSYILDTNLLEEKKRVMSKKRKSQFHDGVKQVQSIEFVKKLCLNTAPHHAQTRQLVIAPKDVADYLASSVPGTDTIYTGSDGSLITWDMEASVKLIRDVMSKRKPSFVFSYLGPNNQHSLDEIVPYLFELETVAETVPIVHIDQQVNGRWTDRYWSDFPESYTPARSHFLCPIHGRGDVSFAANEGHIKELLTRWISSSTHWCAPRTLTELTQPEFQELFRSMCDSCHAHVQAYVAFPAEMTIEENAEDADVMLDEPDDDGRLLPEEVEKAAGKDQEFLDSIPIPGVPEQEANRRRQWLKIPRKARAAIRKMHAEWGHMPNSVLKNVLKIGKADADMIRACDFLRCEHCEMAKDNPQTNKVGPPHNYVFNHECGVDVFDLHDYEGKPHQFLNIVCMGTNFQIVVYLRAGKGTPKSGLCMEAFQTAWTSWAGWPKEVTTDRGLHNRGLFARKLGVMGVSIKNIGLESPEQLGRVERHGGIWKGCGKRVVSSQRITGTEQMRLLATELNPILNDGMKKGGFAPSQWVLGRYPNRPGTLYDEDTALDLGIVSDQVDPNAAFALQNRIRTACRKAFAEHDCSRRVKASILRKSAPLQKEYAVGDLISFKRKQGAHTPDQMWSTPTRIIGFDGPKVAWGLCEGVPVCVATDKIRPCTAAESLAYHYINRTDANLRFDPPTGDEQQNFVDMRPTEGDVEEPGVPEPQTQPEEFIELPPLEDPTDDEGEATPEAEIEETEDVEHEIDQNFQSTLEDIFEPMLDDTQDRTQSSVKRSQETLDDYPRDALNPAPTSVGGSSGSAQSNQLAETLRRSGTQGRGLEILERLDQQSKKARKAKKDPEEFDTALNAFIEERIAIPLGTNKNRRKQMQGKNLRYDQCDKKTQSGLRTSRATEWKKWLDFDAGIKLQGDILDELLSEGHSMIPTQWIETDKREHLKRPGQKHVPELKSRLVACGQNEPREGLRADSPTACDEALNLICSMAACKKFKLKSADFQNAYFNADPIDRLLLLRPPKGGLPGHDPEEKIAIAANKPIYGTADAGRQLYKRVRKIAHQVGMTECKSLPAVYSYQVDGDIKILMGTHVDDVLWCADPEYEHIMDKFLKGFIVKSIDCAMDKPFRFCGCMYSQDKDYNVFVEAKDNTEKILPINFNRGDRTEDAKATEGEISQMRSVVGSLAWIARKTRPDFAYECSKMQSIVGIAQVKHLDTCNQVLHDMKATSGQGLNFKSGVIDFNDAILMTISDASWAGEELVIKDRVFPRRSQHGYFITLAEPKLWDSQDGGHIHFISWKSAVIKRTCRSTMRAETQGMMYGTEHTTKLRASLTQLKGKFIRKDWQESCAQTIRHVWFTDCQSLHDYLCNPIAAACEDKRLEIDLEGLREELWFNADWSLKDQITENQTDKPRWVDTSAMICDPFTKVGREDFKDRMVQTLQTGYFDLTPTEESQLKKLKTQKARLQKASEKAAAKK